MTNQKRILAIMAGVILIGGMIFCQFAYKKEVISAKDLKRQFPEESEQLSPVYNLEQYHQLKFEFALDYKYIDNYSIDGREMVSVYTSPACNGESKVECYIWEEEVAGRTDVYVKPVAPVLPTDSLREEGEESAWGCAPIYYVCIRCDMESSKLKRLNTPIVIPFTVAGESEAPYVSGRVDTLGNLLLTWNPVDDAQYYTVYREESGWLEKVGETKNCAYDFAKGTNENIPMSYQNEGVRGIYYVTATVDGKESNLSAAVDTADLHLPYSLADEGQDGKIYRLVDELPDKVQVVNTDGSVMWRPVSYEMATDGKEACYDFLIQGTQLGGCVYVENTESIRLPKKIEYDTEITYLKRNAQLNKLPTMAVKSVLAQSYVETVGENQGNIIHFYEAAKAQTEENIAIGENDTIAIPKKEYKVFADSAEETWLAYGLLAAEEVIPLRGFPSLHDPYTLEDTFLKVCYQNPYIMGIQSYSFDYEKMELHVNYVYSKRELSERQRKLYKAAEQIYAEIITEDMNEEERIKAIYQWLEEECTYASLEWEQIQEQDFRKNESSQEMEDANNAYGALVKREALCGGYASACQLLGCLANVKVITVNGHLNGNIPHAWNMVHMNGAWYQLDCSSNFFTMKIPFYLYYTDMETAQKRGYELGSDFAMERECVLLHRQNREEKKEYYIVNGLEVTNMAELERVLSENTEEEVIAFHCKEFVLTEKQLVDTVRSVFLRNGKDQQLSQLKYRRLGDYIVLY